MATFTAQMTTYRNFIDGSWVPSVSGDVFENRNPANADDLIGVFQKSTRDDVERAIEAARRAYVQWRLVPAPRRAELLFRAARMIADRKDALARDMTREMGKVLDEAGIPAGVVNLVTGGGSEVGNAMLVSDEVRVVSFTGSTDVGRTVSEKTAPSFKKVHLEMGGKNVIMVMDDANLDLAIEGCVWGGFGTTGQRCTAASRVVVHDRVYKTFLDRFVARARALRVGDGLASDSQMGPLVSEGQLKTVMKYVEIGQKEGATLACGGHRLTSGAYASGFFHEPTIFADVDPAMRIAQEEIFGPVVSVIPCQSFDDAVTIGNNVQYGLSASIYTQDINRAFAAMRDMYTGIFYVNAPTIGAEVHLPSGGTKATGNGHREAGTAALDVFSEWKSVYVDFSGKLQRAQIDTAEL